MAVALVGSLRGTNLILTGAWKAMDSSGKLDAADVPSASANLTAALGDERYANSALVQEYAKAEQQREVTGTAAPLATDIMVDPDKLLDAAKIIQKVLDDARPAIERRLGSLAVHAPGMDPVSTESARLWNQALVEADGSYAHRVRDYLDSLQKLVLNLAESARAYGYRDDDVQAVLHSIAAARPAF